MEDRNLKIARMLYIKYKGHYSIMNDDGFWKYFNSLNVSKEERKSWAKEIIDAYFAILEHVEQKDYYLFRIKDFICDYFLEEEYIRLVEYVDGNYRRFPHEMQIDFAYEILFVIESTFRKDNPIISFTHWDMDRDLKIRTRNIASRIFEEVFAEATDKQILKMATIAIDRIRALDI